MSGAHTGTPNLPRRGFLSTSRFFLWLLVLVLELEHRINRASIIGILLPSADNEVYLYLNKGVPPLIGYRTVAAVCNSSPEFLQFGVSLLDDSLTETTQYRIDSLVFVCVFFIVMHLGIFRCGADWRIGRVVDSGPRGPGFNPQSGRLSLWP